MRDRLIAAQGVMPALAGSLLSKQISDGDPTAVHAQDTNGAEKGIRNMATD